MYDKPVYDVVYKNVLSRIDAELTHKLSLGALRGLDLAGLGSFVEDMYGADLAPVEVLGLTFPNRVGLAAGFDKNATALRALARVGFGHIEVGTITAHYQPGNPEPRLFRLLENRGVLNRMGFNNVGCRQASYNLDKQRRLLRALPPERRPIIGVNIGKTKVVEADAAVTDYRTSARFLAPYADYMVINVSSPNTPGLRDLQAVDALAPLIRAVKDQIAEVVSTPRSTLGHVPLLVKIAPDLSDEDVLAVADLCVAEGADGLICTNTTIDRSVLRGADREFAERQTGGISGPPVAARALAVLKLVKAHTDALTLISVGGIETPEDAVERIEAGAALVQGMTGMIYRGPGWAREIARVLSGQ